MGAGDTLTRAVCSCITWRKKGSADRGQGGGRSGRRPARGARPPLRATGGTPRFTMLYNGPGDALTRLSAVLSVVKVTDAWAGGRLGRGTPGQGEALTFATLGQGGARVPSFLTRELRALGGALLRLQRDAAFLQCFTMGRGTR